MADKKGKSLSFSQAHGPGMCSVSYIQHTTGMHLVTCGPDGKASYRSASKPGEVIKSYDNGEGCALHCVRASPKGDRVAVADEKYFIKVRRPTGPSIAAAGASSRHCWLAAAPICCAWAIRQQG
jgi:hypothetical protein